MNINEIYLNTIEKLKRDQRPQIKLTPELISEIKIQWQKAIEGPMVDEDLLKKVLCILDNTQNMTTELNALFIQTLEKIVNKDLIIYTLAASQKHIIAESAKTGVMIQSAYFDKLKNLLHTNNPEVLEWTLRTIEGLGPLSLRLKNEVRAAKPGFLKFLNQHQKSSSEIIDLMEKQWKKYL